MRGDRESPRQGRRRGLSERSPEKGLDALLHPSRAIRPGLPLRAFFQTEMVRREDDGGIRRGAHARRPRRARLRSCAHPRQLAVKLRRGGEKALRRARSRVLSECRRRFSCQSHAPCQVAVFGGHSHLSVALFRARRGRSRPRRQVRSARPLFRPRRQGGLCLRTRSRCHRHGLRRPSSQGGTHKEVRRKDVCGQCPSHALGRHGVRAALRGQVRFRHGGRAVHLFRHIQKAPRRIFAARRGSHRETRRDPTPHN